MIDEDDTPTAELLRLAAVVQGSGEVLEHLRHNCTERTRLTLSTSKPLADFTSEPHCRLSTQALLQLGVELGYFLYSCRNHQVTPLIQEKVDLRVEECWGGRPNDKKVRVVLWYRLEAGKMADNLGMETYRKVGQELEEQWGNYSKNREQREETAAEAELEKQVETYFEQMGTILENEFYMSNEIAFFMGVEKMDAFNNHSMLYRIKNCSLMDYIKTHEKRGEALKKSKNTDEALVVEYHKEKSRNKSEQELAKVKEKEREIEDNLEAFFRDINPEGFEVIKKADKDQGSRVRFSFLLKERERLPFNEALEEIEGVGMRSEIKVEQKHFRQPSEMVFQVEYSSEGNHICVKLFSPGVRVNIENSDFLMFQSNVLTYEAVNVSIELCPYADKSLKPNQEPPRVVAFKGNSSFPVKEPPLEKILLLMDITLIASKVYEPELTSSKATTHKDYKRLTQLSRQINHYTKLFMHCAKKVYG